MIQKILVVEDEKDLLFALASKLESEGFVVVQSVSGPDALHKVQEEKPDLILLDIIIIVKTGLEFLKELREDLHNMTPVIISSNLSEQEYIDRAQKYGISGYIVKSSSSLQEIVDKIRSLSSL
jgi:DNA-binding response OmpR family regulator